MHQNKKNMPNTTAELVESFKKIPGLTATYHGKVRTVMEFKKLEYQDQNYGNVVILIAGDSMSAFDHLFQQQFTKKGAILTDISSWWFDRLKDICPNHFIKQPHPNVTIAHKCIPIRLEVIVRGFLTGSVWKSYQKGDRFIGDRTLPNGMEEFERFTQPIITLTTKAPHGQKDLPINADEAIKHFLIAKDHWEKIKKYAQNLFTEGSRISKEKGLILIDTKYEFGIHCTTKEIVLIDEVHTPDSSRFLSQKEFENFQKGLSTSNQLTNYSKEDFRKWLQVSGFTNAPGEVPPSIPSEIIEKVLEKYTFVREKLLGKAHHQGTN